MVNIVVEYNLSVLLNKSPGTKQVSFFMPSTGYGEKYCDHSARAQCMDHLQIATFRPQIWSKIPAKILTF